MTPAGPNERRAGLYLVTRQNGFACARRQPVRGLGLPLDPVFPGARSNPLPCPWVGQTTLGLGDLAPFTPRPVAHPVRSPGVHPRGWLGTLVRDLLVATALLLVIEGIWPFLSPGSFKRALLQVSSEGDRALRVAGFASMVIGVGLLYWVN